MTDEKRMQRKVDNFFKVLEEKGFLTPEPPSVQEKREKSVTNYNFPFPFQSRIDIEKLKSRCREEGTRFLLLFAIGIGTTLKPSELLALTTDEIEIDKVDTVYGHLPDAKVGILVWKFRINLRDINDFIAIGKFLDEHPSEKLFNKKSGKELSGWVANLAKSAELEAPEGCGFTSESLRKTHGYMLFKENPDVNLVRLAKMYNKTKGDEAGNYLAIPVAERKKLKPEPPPISFEV